MTSLQDLHFAAALAVVKAQTLSNLEPLQNVDSKKIEELQQEVEQLRTENKRLKGQIEAAARISRVAEASYLPDSIFLNVIDPVKKDIVKQVDIVRSYIERCGDDNHSSGTIFVDITCDSISAFSHPSIRQNTDDVVYAASWIGDIAFGTNVDPPAQCIGRVSDSLMEMMNIFRTTDCFSEEFLSTTLQWRQKSKTVYADIREQVMRFLIHLANNSTTTGFILAGLCSQLLAIFNLAATTTETSDNIRYSQNASFVCRAIECILGEASRSGKGNNIESTCSNNLLRLSGLKEWVVFWSEILTASVSICTKLPLATRFVWNLAAFIEGGSGTAFRVAFQEMNKKDVHF